MSLLSNSPTATLDVSHSLQLAAGAGGGTGRGRLHHTTDAAMLLSPRTPPARAPELGQWLLGYTGNYAAICSQLGAGYPGRE